MLEILKIKISQNGDQLTPSLSFRDLYDQIVNQRNIVILQSAFDSTFLNVLKKDIFHWGKSPLNHSKTYLGKSYCRIDNMHPSSITPHVFQAYNFDLPDENLGRELQVNLNRLFSPMSKLQHAICFYNSKYEMSGAATPRLRPQVIHYPCNGGMFDYHLHPLFPQKVGLILNLSKKGVDYDGGGTSFYHCGKEVSISDYHDMGDIALFRYDLLHSVESIKYSSNSIDDNIEIKGKWSAILPLF